MHVTIAPLPYTTNKDRTKILSARSSHLDTGRAPPSLIHHVSPPPLQTTTYIHFSCAQTITWINIVWRLAISCSLFIRCFRLVALSFLKIKYSCVHPRMPMSSQRRCIPTLCILMRICIMTLTSRFQKVAWREALYFFENSAGELLDILIEEWVSYKDDRPKHTIQQRWLGSAG
jgi:hypothetical protein